jgi:anti-sigma B factor antagonist
VSLLDIAVVTDADHVAVRLSGEADLSTSAELGAALRSAAALRSGDVLVDVAELRFCDCSGLRELACLRVELRREGRACRLTGASATLRRLLELAGFTDLIDGGTPAAV